MEVLNHTQVYKLPDEELQQKAELVMEYIRLLKDYTDYNCGVGWKPEYEAERERIKNRLIYIRRALGLEEIDVGKGSPGK